MAKDPAPTLVPVKLLYATWIGEQRHEEGEIIHLSLEQAKKVLADRKAERADPLPGEA